MTTTSPPLSPITAEQEQVRPLAPAASRHSHRMDVESGTRTDQSTEAKDRRKHQCIKCCGCCSVATIIIILVLVILALTVFRVRDPKVKMDSIQIDGLSSLTTANLNPNVNLSLSAGISVKNPNAVSFRFDQTTTSLIYDGRMVGEAISPAGNARARRTLRMDVRINVLVQNLLSVSRLPGDLVARRMPVGLSTTVHGRAKVLIIKKSATVRMNCTMSFDLSSQSIQDLDCDKKVSL